MDFRDGWAQLNDHERSPGNSGFAGRSVAMYRDFNLQQFGATSPTGAHQHDVELAHVGCNIAQFLQHSRHTLTYTERIYELAVDTREAGPEGIS